ncbi:MAG: hypothetical protein QNJ46_15505 [Leptolyngbyaceae cyanobacterium MO_188.B28]|nr:hypothetical protein [Leptolyngbyaceae cyanobacterium MO_188.B28]
MDSTDRFDSPDVRAHKPAHPSAQTAHYSAKQIADQLQVGESTIRTRWFEWLKKVAPEPLLKDKQGFTELARSLFAEFAQVEKGDRPQWVADAKARYAQEWGSAGVIEGELMPDQVGGALALLNRRNSSLQQSLETELADLEAFVQQVNEAEADFSQAELEAFRTSGAKRGIVRFKIETQAELEMLNTLRQQRMGGQDGA